MQNVISKALSVSIQLVEMLRNTCYIVNLAKSGAFTGLNVTRRPEILQFRTLLNIKQKTEPD